MLEVRDLQVIYPNGFEALRSITLQAQAGQIVAIIGRSGAGKSTLLRCIAGLQQPTAGAIRLSGIDITNLGGEELRVTQRQIGFIWQEFNLVLRLSALQNVLCGRLGHHQGISSLFFYFDRRQREIAVRCLERVNLIHRAKQRADRLSGGEKQRCAIARALAQEPAIILADEPVASLDQELAWQVMSDLARVAREEGVPTVINIHTVELARAFADRIVGIAEGQVVFDGRPDELDQAALDRVYRFDREPVSAVVQAERIAAGAAL